MATFVWACFDGGGNVPPSVGIAHALTARGHRVVFAGRPEMAPRVTAAGLPATVLESSYAHAEAYAWHPRGRLFSYLTDPAVGDEVLAVGADEHADVLVVDAMFGAALDAAPRAGLPVAVMLHTFLHRTIDGWETLMGDQAAARHRAGLGAMADVRTLWGRADALHVNALEEFDSPARSPWPNARHGAPVLALDSRAKPLGTAHDDRPHVVVSFSTAVAQSSVGKLQRTLDGLAGLPVRVTATVGAVPPESLVVPPNATAVAFADHGRLMQDAALVVTHGGHGTAMRALRHAVPVVCLTGRAEDQEGVAALDQPRVAAFLEERGAGRSLPADAPAQAVAAAAGAVLTEASYAAAARRLAAALQARDGAAEAADRLEGLLTT
ncbi:nucleotide disphospho-sugar-binding domain-containing protein [Cellulomonas uda]|uniref:nucleotide disphospho-sugar-binding domain-containing protein n=2 Tax=Cellulomonas uda TaxID=1714 RepID=UPI00141BC1A2|nr:UDP:flavonoid glycosyltransferase YjiC (YdhE family) [Cellulomonas uda]